MNTDTRPAPADITIDSPNGVLKIAWKDGAACEIPLPLVRKSCPCAQCNEERNKPQDPLRHFTPAQMGTAKVTSAELVGLYALKIRWQDGHDTGIYSWDLLARLCNP
jgi:DUF971 family protein